MFIIDVLFTDWPVAEEIILRKNSACLRPDLKDCRRARAGTEFSRWKIACSILLAIPPWKGSTTGLPAGIFDRRGKE